MKYLSYLLISLALALGCISCGNSDSDSSSGNFTLSGSDS
jgi:hypothetical protein